MSWFLDIATGEPKINVHPESQIKPEGSNLTLSCSADGNPVPTISWTKDGSPISSNPRISFSADNQQLTIKDVRRTYSGEYRCVAHNRLGNETSKAATLDIQCNIFALVNETRVGLCLNNFLSLSFSCCSFFLSLHSSDVFL